MASPERPEPAAVPPLHIIIEDAIESFRLDRLTGREG